MWWPRRKHVRAGRKVREVSGSKKPMTMLCEWQSQRTNFTDECGGRFCVEAAQSSVLWLGREKKIQEWTGQTLLEVLPGYSGGKLPGRSTQEKGREEGAADKDGGERRLRSQIAQEVVEGIKEKVSVHSGDKEAV